MEINVTCNACGEKLVGYAGPDAVSIGIDPHTCPMPEPPEGVVLKTPHEFLGIPEPVCAQCGAPAAEQAPEPDVVWERPDKERRVLADGSEWFFYAGSWEKSTNKELCQPFAACVRALRAQDSFLHATAPGSWDRFTAALAEARALGVRI